MALRVAVIGGGWYGCHMGLSLKGLGFDVQIFERHDRLLNEASGNNQFRLHLGFHYARHHGTRLQSRDGFMRFMERYPNLSREVAENIYAVPREDSLIDFPTYRLVMTASGLEFRELRENSAGLRGVDGMLLTGERVLLIERARQYFKQNLDGVLHLGTEVESVESVGAHVVVNGEPFDYLIDCTWGHRGGLPIRFFYEPTILLYYECDVPFPAVTMVDGPLCSVYPTEDPNIYTLSSVPHTPLGRFDSSAEARAARDAVTGHVVAEKCAAMEDQISRYLPDFRDRFRFLGPQLAIKTKPVGKFDDRSCYVFRRGRVFTVMSGKIDTIFFAVERVLSFIEAGAGDYSEFGGSLLRQEIAAAAGGER
ncbi:MAG: FAD-dependent oxidoreductase [Rhizobiales bacterium 24-66-13]|uniref:FAD-dependent oxidoreductase n=1 Tax=Roseixanthobacter finlandensis TaxID=3119922 RepID=UPI000BD354AB|nr:MAG: FAD-dependent oxidoreductase [Rhizobiales bacterium 35-66-30]OYZ81596.1 MAG: FAD-dependent oxidoreductase [Rhizobiales bacterium 24-66-13]OZB10066.1 MAG: FAD-dependent oxidoreductase [Rhizobiales bacterium 39-66-18]HQS47307.1 FAD-dependent oxidoreductase [Xanthobacteraceae bacterium]